MNKKYAKVQSTRRSLIMSVLSLVLCFTMLLGTTWAWFTDEVTSGSNRIVAGNLDIDLLMDKGGEEGYVSIAGGTGDIFKEADKAQNSNATLWEPGKTQFAKLAIENKGNLALKYTAYIDVTDEGLVGSLEYALISGKTAIATSGYTKWSEVKAAVQAAGGAIGDVTPGRNTIATGVLDEIVNGTQNERDYVLLAVHMKEEAGNEYQGKDCIIDVTIVATQKDAESDAFDNQYDAGASTNEPAAPMHETASSKAIAMTGTESTITQIDGTDASGIQEVEIKSGSTVATATVPVSAAQSKMVELLPNEGVDTSKNREMVLNLNVNTTENTVTSVTYEIGVTADITYYTTGSEQATVETGKTVNNLSDYLTATINIGANLKNVTVTHSGNEMTAMTSATQTTGIGENGGYYYDKDTGVLTIKSKNFSPFEVSYEAAKSDKRMLEEGAIVRIVGADTVYKVDPSKEELDTAAEVLQACINDAGFGQTIKMLQDVDIHYSTSENFEVVTCFTVPTSKSLTLDMNGHYIKATKSENVKIDPRVCIFRIESGATISFVSTAEQKGLLQTDLSWELIANGGTIPAIDNIEIKSTETTTSSSDRRPAVIWNTGTITSISDSVIGFDGTGDNGIDVLTNRSTGTIGTISNSRIYCHQAGKLTYKYAVTNTGTINKITNSTLSIESDINSESHQQNFTLYNSGTIGELDAVTINGLMTAISNSGKINKFESSNNVVNGEVAGGGTYNIKAGTFSKQVMQTYLAPEYMCVSDGNGKYKVEYNKEGYDALPKAAAIGDTQYLNFAQAYAAATSGQTIKLLADVSEQLIINKAITLDLNGHNIIPINADKSYAVRVNNGHVVITDSTANPGSIGAAENHNWWYTLLVGGLNSDLTIENISIYDGAVCGVYLIGGTNNAKVGFTSGTIYANNGNTGGISIGATNGVFTMSGTAKIEVANGKTGVNINIGDYGKTTPTFNMDGGSIVATGSGNCIVNQSVDYGKVELKNATITTVTGTALNVGGVTIDNCTISRTGSSGSAISLKHDGYDRSYNNCTMTIKGGSIINGSISAQHEDKWTIVLENGTYNNSGKSQTWFEKYVNSSNYNISCTGTTACTVTAKNS